MTANEARKMAEDATTIDAKQVAAYLGHWEGHIAKAAKNGETSIRESDIGALRMHIDTKAKKEVFTQLRRNGFKIIVDDDDDVIVSWA